MSAKKNELLINRIYERTKAGKRKWEKTPRSGVFQTSFPNFSVQIARRPSAEYADDHDFILRIYDDEGDLIEELIDTDFVGEDGAVPIYRVMEDLYSIARQSALGVDQALDSILRDLDKD